MSENRGGQAVRVVVYIMLVASAGVSMLFGDRLWTAWREGAVPMWAPLLAPGTFTAFVAVYAVDRWLLVQNRRYPAPRAFFQVAMALVFLTLLLPQQASELRQLKPAETSLREPALLLLGHNDESVRLAACEVLLGRLPGDVYQRIESVAQGDPAPQVRQACGRTLERLRGDHEAL